MSTSAVYDRVNGWLEYHTVTKDGRFIAIGGEIFTWIYKYTTNTREQGYGMKISGDLCTVIYSCRTLSMCGELWI